ncbi:sialate O-acetylesterase [Massilia terrae]|uniref:Sialate O-acetylesterase n=1 Tax=Massilia terrae TaxID=1811224 RepID=A0ABT2CVI1_9BURK|nr:sialate O-acetylesterase [Massilia terrae]MCS0657215.1 sialate O-acetylesterase [Massilia terrae]
MYQTNRPWRLALALAALFAASAADAAVRLPAIISDHLVLQRADKVPVWGWAAPNEQVSVKIGTQEKTVRAGADGKWSVQLDLRRTSDAPGPLAVRGQGNEIVVNDVLVGEVWLASGQSNMQKPLGEQHGQKPTLNSEAEIAAANHPAIRLFKVSRNKAQKPGDDVSGKWVVCTPESVEATKFSAAAYFFGRRLNQELHTPVGLIDSTVGGTRIELWTPVENQTADAWPASDLSILYNGMVAGLAPFGIKGVIWYQGESNIMDTDDGAAYAGKMKALVSGWRQHWNASFPFYYVQVAPHLYHSTRHDRVTDSDAEPRLWEAQAQSLRIPGTGMIVTTDLVDDLRDIHPRDKKTVGERLANVALVQAYDRRDIEAYGPAFKSMAIEGDKAILSFAHADGLAARDGKALSWFDIAGADGRYYSAKASIEQGKVVLSSPKVPHPVKARFAWDEAAQPNLVNKAGLPGVPFRSEQPVPEGENE